MLNNLSKFVYILDFISIIFVISEFDKYYIINYREFGKSWKTLTNDKDDNDLSRNGRCTLV